MYVDYSFYEMEYGGKVPQEDFINLEVKASGIINYYTFNRIEILTQGVKFAICELVDCLADEYKKANEKEIQSETVGSHSVTYAISKASNIGNKSNNNYRRILNKYLAHTNLLYRGF